MLTIRILNWEKYQPRTDYKLTTWFRCDAKIYRSDALFKADDNQRWLFICILGLVTEYGLDGLVSKDKDWVVHYLNTTEKKLISALAFLKSVNLIDYTDESESDRNRSNPIGTDLISALHNITLHNITEHNKSMSAKPTPPCLVSIWNENRGTLPAARPAKTQGRAVKIKARLEEEPDPAYWVNVVKKLAASDFATGQTGDRRWKADFTWLVSNGENHLKVTEGRYDNRESGGINWEEIGDNSHLEGQK